MTAAPIAPGPAAVPAPPGRPALGFWSALGLIASLELRQRTRSVVLWVLLAVWFGIIGIVTFLAWFVIAGAASAFGSDADAYPIFSVIVFFVLLFGSLVAPAVSGNAINSERNAATLATTQVTLVGTWAIVLGKFLAAWITGLAFLVAATPYIVFTVIAGNVDVGGFAAAILALALELGVLTAIGVGLSALISSPVFSIVVTYLSVAALSIGTLIAFWLGVLASNQYVEVETTYPSQAYYDALVDCDGDTACERAEPLDCTTETMTTTVTRTDRVWWILAANPYVVVADLVPARYDTYGSPTDAFGIISSGVRLAQLPPQILTDIDQCVPAYDTQGYPSPEERVAGTMPSWWMGLGVQLVLATAAIVGGAAKVHTPSRRIPRGTRVA